MHPRNRYKDKKPDFGAYAATRSTLKPFLIERKRPSQDGLTYTLDFSNVDALRELTCACLEHDFGLHVEIPEGHLVPTVPQKLNYIHWVEDLLALDSDSGEIAAGDQVKGIDIGTGASCIYPLLGATLNGWSFLASDVLVESVDCAMRNVCRNSLEEKVTVKLVHPDVVLMDIVDHSPGVSYHFCMCNPPFFSDEKDQSAKQSRTNHRPIPSTQNTGNMSETITCGGEVEFVKRIIADSLKLMEKIRWYSSMLGKKSSLKLVRAELTKLKIPVIHTTQFVQGKTHRWAIAWSFVPPSPSPSSTSPYSGAKHKACVISCLPFSGLRVAIEWLQDMWRDLKIEYSLQQETDSLICARCTAATNTWSHQRRRRRIMARLRQLAEEEGEKNKDQEEELKQPLTITVSGDDEEGGSHAEGREPSKAKHVSRAELQSHLESLNTPCQLEFTATVCLTTPDDCPPPTKKRKLDRSRNSREVEKKITRSENEKAGLSLSLEWVSGNDRDHLHQLLQLTHNKLSEYDTGSRQSYRNKQE